MIEYVNSFLLLRLLGIIFYIYYKYKTDLFLRAIDIVMDSVILDQLNNLQEKDVDFEVKVIKTRRGHKKKTNTKTLPKINEED